MLILFIILFSIQCFPEQVPHQSILAEFDPKTNSIYYNGSIYYTNITPLYMLSSSHNVEEEDSWMKYLFGFNSFEDFRHHLFSNFPDTTGKNVPLLYFATFTCVCVAALAAGLTMGLVSLESFDLKILICASEDDCATKQERLELKKEKQCASKLYPLVKRHHLMLVTLLLLNSIANEALPLFLNQITPPFLAVTISVTFVVIFGEIIPSALFTGPNQLTIAAFFTPLVWFFIYLFFFIAYPISWVLDQFLGEEHKGRYNKAEFRALINLHDEDIESSRHTPEYTSITSNRRLNQGVVGGGRQSDHSHTKSSPKDQSRRKWQQTMSKLTNSETPGKRYRMGALSTGIGNKQNNNSDQNNTIMIDNNSTTTSSDEQFLNKGDDLKNSTPIHRHGSSQSTHTHMLPSGISREEIAIMQGALEIHRLKVNAVMTPMDQVFMMDTGTCLNASALSDLVNKGHSRVPVYQGHPHNIRGMLLVKKLVVVDPGANVLVSDIDLNEPLFVSGECTLLDMLYEFATGRSHLAIVTNEPNRVLDSIRTNQQIPVNIHLQGIITLEDVIEKLIKHEIIDETDINSEHQFILHTTHDHQIVYTSEQPMIEEESLMTDKPTSPPIPIKLTVSHNDEKANNSIKLSVKNTNTLSTPLLTRID